MEELLALFFENLLNSSPTNNGRFDFNINAQLGEYKYQPRQGKIHVKNAPIINGTLIARPTEYVPIYQYDVFEHNSVLTFVVEEPFANDVYDIVDAVSYKLVGTTETIGDVKVQFNFDRPTMGAMESRPGVGSSVEIKLFMRALIHDTSVSSNSIRIWLKDTTVSNSWEELLVLQGAVANTSTLETANVKNDEFATSIKTMQSIVFNGKFAYRDTPILKRLVRDIFEGSIEKTYLFRYSDGVAFTGTNSDFAKFDVLSSQITLSFAKGAIASIDVNMTKAQL